MSICITLSALCINLLKVHTYYRTYILVFLPLTLIWLQIHTSSKIPVIEESTKLENLIMCCFFTTIISCFESGILYCIINNKYLTLLKYYKLNNYKKVASGYHNLNNNIIKHYNSENNNKDYKKFTKLILHIDNFFRLIIDLFFVISVITILNI